MSILDIDEHALDREWLSLPKLYHKWSEDYVLAKAEEDRLKGNFELVEATVAGEVRIGPAAFGLAKATDAACKEAIIQDDRYQKAQKRYLEAKTATAKLKAMVDSLEVKKRALESLVTLMTRDYYSEPKAPANAREAMDARKRERVAEKVREKK